MGKHYFVNLSLGIQPSVNFSQKWHSFGFGMGLNTYSSWDARPDDLYVQDGDATLYLTLNPQLSYTKYFKKRPYFIRANILMVVSLKYFELGGISSHSTDFVLPWAGFGFGYCFGKK
ncbi:MAG: hypothetical protein QM642_04065 [Edaphocola sp.]